MNFIKKNLFLIICVLAILLGIGVFISATLIASGNSEELKSIETTCKGVNPLRARIVPDNLLTRIEENAQLAENDSNTVKNLAVQTSQRPLIYEKVFPALERLDERFHHYQNFANRYCQMIDGFIQELNAGGSTFCCFTAFERSATVRPRVFSRSGRTQMRIA